MKITTLLLAAIVALPLATFAQMKTPQGPTTQKQVKPKPKPQPTRAAYTNDVRKYILDEQKKHKGYFLVHDSVQKKKLRLKLVRVHTDKFTNIGNHTYFDCVDFNGKDGNKYDIDIFLKWDGNKFSTITRKLVHKMNGKPRYVWNRVNGNWVTEPPTKENMAKPHPDHPGH